MKNQQDPALLQYIINDVQFSTNLLSMIPRKNAWQTITEKFWHGPWGLS